MELMNRIVKFIKYWYMRYLLITELYMVDTWEKVVTHITFAIIFSVFSYFNYSIVLNGISQLRGTTYIGRISV